MEVNIVLKKKILISVHRQNYMVREPYGDQDLAASCDLYLPDWLSASPIHPISTAHAVLQYFLGWWLCAMYFLGYEEIP